MSAPPTFSRSELSPASEAVVVAWKDWMLAVRNLERDALALPMDDGKLRVQRANLAMLAYIAARGAYAEAVASYLESHQGSGTASKSRITIEAVSGDELDLLGTHLAEVQKRLDELRNTPEWTRIRRAVLSDRADVLKLEDSRRDLIPDGLLSTRQETPALKSPVYRQAEAEVREAIQKLWGDYYQSLADAIYQRPDGSVSSNSSLSISASPALDESAQAPGGNRLAGAWTYLDGTQQFNGVAEPKHVVLELWLENGQLAGRYRADLPDFEGTRHVDLRLSAGSAKGREQSMDFQTDSGATGRIVLQGPGASGIEIMLIRPPGIKGIPRGRELLTRR